MRTHGQAIRAACIIFAAFLIAPPPPSAAGGDSGAASFTFDLHLHDPPPPPSHARASQQPRTPWRHRVSPRVLAAIDPAAAAAGAQAPVGPITEGMPVMKISVGTPPVEIYGIADTGSDLIWTQCTPCTPHCSPQRNPIFDPSKSPTYRVVPCSDPKCAPFTENFPCGGAPDNACRYRYGYTGIDTTGGNLAIDKFTVPSGTGAPVTGDLYFGCSHNNTGSLADTTTGIIGLGGGPQSLLSQLSAAGGGKRMMSQCLMPAGSDPKKMGRTMFGSAAEVAGPGVTTIEMVQPYTAELQGITVGGVALPMAAGGGVTIIFDSGSTGTYLPTDLFRQLEAEVKKQVTMTPVDVPDETLCYQSEKMAAPDFTFRFRGGDVVLSTVQMFVQDSPGVYCLAVADAGKLGDTRLYGNTAQANFLIGFDLDDMKISLKPTDCTLQ